MNRFALALVGIALMASGAGCCCRHLYGNPCNPCAPGYGALGATTFGTGSTAFVAPAATTAVITTPTTAYYAPAAVTVSAGPEWVTPVY